MEAEKTVTEQDVLDMIRKLSDLQQAYRREPQLLMRTEIDLFDDDFPDEWILKVFAICNRSPYKRFLFSTHNIQRMRDFAAKNPFPDNITIYTKKDFKCIYCGSAFRKPPF